MKSQLARIYLRQFKSADDAASFISASHIVSERVSAVEVKYRLYQLEDDPAILYEIWEYPDDDSMRWVQSSMEGATVIPRTLAPKTKVHTAIVANAFDCEE